MLTIFWSTHRCLSVFLQLEDLPRASTVSSCETGRPFATAVATVRECCAPGLVMLFAIVVHVLGQAPRHVPLTALDLRLAAEAALGTRPRVQPRGDLVPTNVDNWSTILLSVFFSSRIHRRAVDRELLVSSPFATGASQTVGDGLRT